MKPLMVCSLLAMAASYGQEFTRGIGVYPGPWVDMALRVASTLF